MIYRLVREGRHNGAACRVASKQTPCMVSRFIGLCGELGVQGRRLLLQAPANLHDYLLLELQFSKPGAFYRN